mmetsp:Transcript_23461/g.55590  ORF Transcript_23461/g.55590 Transcript_23461/m.55590 type:complete len:748 (+) Transcript_23461:220-2463(+)
MMMMMPATHHRHQAPQQQNSPKLRLSSSSSSSHTRRSRSSFVVLGIQILVVMLTISSVYFSSVLQVSTVTVSEGSSSSSTAPTTSKSSSSLIGSSKNTINNKHPIVKSSSLQTIPTTTTKTKTKTKAPGAAAAAAAAASTTTSRASSKPSIPSIKIEDPILSLESSSSLSSSSSSLPKTTTRTTNVRILLFQSAAEEQSGGFGFRSIIEDEDKDEKWGDNEEGDEDRRGKEEDMDRKRRRWKEQMSDELLNICLDGFERSAYFEVLEPTIVVESSANNTTSTTSNASPLLKETRPVVWVIDVRRLFVTRTKYILDPLIELVYQTRKWQIQQQVQGLELPSIHVVFMDYRDRWSRTFCKFHTNMVDKILQDERITQRIHLLASFADASTANTKPDNKDYLRSVMTTPIEILRFLVGKNNVRHVRRQIVQGRVWEEAVDADTKDDSKKKKNKSKSRINPGVIVPKASSQVLDRCYGTDIPTITIMKNTKTKTTTTTTTTMASSSMSKSSSSKNENAYLHVPYTVRSDYVGAVLATFQEHLPRSEQPQKQEADKSLQLLPPDTYRPIDASHLFDPYSKEKKAELRKAVSLLLLDLQQDAELKQQQRNHNNLTVVAGAVSTAANVGRTSVQSRYLEVLLSSKIVVVAQRDEWEDHYRLFEAIVGGALVMTDFMWSLPPGYQDGVNIIVYNDLDELRRKILYYVDPKHEQKRISIAHAGWKLAMEHHRSYHWMERLFFGQGLSVSESADIED